MLRKKCPMLHSKTGPAYIDSVSPSNSKILRFSPLASLNHKCFCLKLKKYFTHKSGNIE